MDFDLTEDQQLLTQTLDRLLADHYDFERRKSYASSALGWSREQWQRYAEMGLLGLPFAEADGGLGCGAIETMLVMEAFGRSLVLEQRSDFLWLRVLDVPAALVARRYAIAGELVLDVHDDAPTTTVDVSGRYALRAADDKVDCAPTDRPADLELTQRALASIYLGGVRPTELLASGAVTELTTGALEHARLLFSAPLPPWNATGF